MKTKIFIATMALIGSFALLSSCKDELTIPGEDLSLIEKSGDLPAGTVTCTTCDFTAVLTNQEKADLVWMREEEKLARDVYKTMYDKYRSLVFKNISASEQVHMNALLYLINGYKLEDPVKSDEVGKFTNPAFTTLYTELINRGNTSLTEALKVGVDIEKLDISDLKKAIGVTDKTNIKRVYTNLSNASEAHLKSFTFNLSRLGVTYP